MEEGTDQATYGDTIVWVEASSCRQLRQAACVITSQPRPTWVSGGLVAQAVVHIDGGGRINVDGVQEPQNLGGWDGTGGEVGGEGGRRARTPGTRGPTYVMQAPAEA